MARSKRAIRRSIDSLNQRRNEHYEKIKNAIETNTNIECIPKWKKEIENFGQQIDDLLNKLN
jgi:hypothetical protein